MRLKFGAICAIIHSYRKPYEENYLGENMKIIIFGCGKIGTTIVSCLSEEGHDIVVVDNDRQAITEITNMYDVIGICGNGADCDTLTEAHVESCDMFIAVTGSDELNMLACYIARRMGAKNTVARIRNPEYNDQSLVSLKDYLGLTSALNPESLIAHEVYNVLRFPSAIKVETFTSRRLEIVELILKEESPLIGISMIELRKKYTAKFLICAVLRDGEIFIPDGRFELKLGDRIALSAAPNEIHKLLKKLVCQGPCFPKACWPDGPVAKRPSQDGLSLSSLLASSDSLLLHICSCFHISWY